MPSPSRVAIAPNVGATTPKSLSQANEVEIFRLSGRMLEMLASTTTTAM